MIIQDLQIDSLREYEHNPRQNEQAVEAVAESIKQFGFRVPVVVDKNRTIIAGHTRVKAAAQLGLDAVPCIVAEDLSPEQVKAFRLADNKTGELAEWDWDLLEQELAELTAFDVDMTAFGFENDEEPWEDAEPEEKPEIAFTKSLEENHNYVVLYFDNDIDWLQAQTVFDIQPVKEYSSRKDGQIKKPVRGIGRVLDGAEALNRLGAFE